MLVYVTNDSIPQTENEGKFKGEVSFGLFHGKKVLNYGLGPRHSTFSGKYGIRPISLSFFSVRCIMSRIYMSMQAKEETKILTVRALCTVAVTKSYSEGILRKHYCE